MKTLLEHVTDDRIAGSGVLLAIASLLLTALPLAAAATTTPYTATSVVIGHPYGGVWITNETGRSSRSFLTEPSLALGPVTQSQAEKGQFLILVIHSPDVFRGDTAND